jgi:hypothetical protein
MLRSTLTGFAATWRKLVVLLVLHKALRYTEHYVLCYVHNATRKATSDAIPTTLLKKPCALRKALRYAEHYVFCVKRSGTQKSTSFVMHMGLYSTLTGFAVQTTAYAKHWAVFTIIHLYVLLCIPSYTPTLHTTCGTTLCYAYCYTPLRSAMHTSTLYTTYKTQCYTKCIATLCYTYCQTTLRIMSA